MQNLDERVREAVRHFWRTRSAQTENQGKASGVLDQGSRKAVTGGKQMDGFVTLIRDLLMEVGIHENAIYHKKCIELPGYFRAEKQWDLLVVVEKRLVAAIEFKSQVGSFGNNFNNRTEEALGTATDLWAAYREGAFQPSNRPWLGYLMLLEEAEGALRPVKPAEPHFRIFEEFRGASYAKRYELLLLKLLRERLYDGTCLLLSNRESGLDGGYHEPNLELTVKALVQSLLAQALAIVQAN